MSLPEIKTLDVDGALREAEEAVAGDSRAAFFRKAAIGGGAVVSSSAILGMLPALANAAKSPANDVKIANYALTLEYLEAAFYKQAVKNISFTVDGAEGFAKLVAKHEKIHVQTLQKTLGSAAVKSPKFDFGKAVKDEDTFLATAFVLENTGVHAYLGQVTKISQAPILAAAASIVTIEARHAAGIAVINGNKAFADKSAGSITPDGAFDTPLSKKAILKAVGKTGFIKS
jgi:hypothetical protein